MKSLLVLFFGICVIMTTATAYVNQQNLYIQKDEVSTNDNPRILIKLVKNLFAKAKNQALKGIEFLQTEVIKLADESIRMFQYSDDSKLTNAKKITNAAIRKLKNVNNSKCSEIYLPKLEDVIIKGELDVRKSIYYAAALIEDKKGIVQGYIDGIQLELLNIIHVIPKCTKLLTPQEIHNCIVKDVNTVGTNALSKMPAAYKSLDDIAYLFHRYVTEIGPYIKISADQTEANAKAISAQIDECLK